MKLSFILPIFNTGKYLQKCIDSAMAQSLPTEDFEILLVYDEGSTDNSLEVAEQNAFANPNVRLIRHSNRSIGESLNYAFPLTKGDFVEVIDTDDYLEPDTIAPLLMRMESEHLDVLRFKFQNVNEEYHVFQYNKHPYSGMDFSDKVTNGLDFLINRFGYACYVPTLIFRRELLLRPGNEMLEIAINDAEWLPRILVQAERASSEDKIAYNYLIRNTSKMHSGNEIKIVEETFKVWDRYLPYLNTKAREWYLEAMSRGTIAILSRVALFTLPQLKYYLNRLQSYPIFPLQQGEQSWRKAIINLSPMLYCFLLRIHLRFAQK